MRLMLRQVNCATHLPSPYGVLRSLHESEAAAELFAASGLALWGGWVLFCDDLYCGAAMFV